MDNKKELNFDEIKSKIKELKFNEKSEKKDFVEMISLFSSLREIKEIEEFEIKELFNYSIEKLGDNYWKFILEIFGKTFYDTKSKFSKKVESLIKNCIEISLSDIFDQNSINLIISNLVSDDGYFQLKNYISTTLLKKNNEKSKQLEYNSLFYVLILLRIKIQYPNLNTTIIKNAQKAFIESLSFEDKEDYLSVKRNIRALLKNEFKTKFYDTSFLYIGQTDKINNLNKDIENLNSIIDTKNKKITNLNIELKQKEEEINLLKNDLSNKLKLIESLQQDLNETNNRNDFDKNRYEQQYKTLKKTFIDKLKSDLKLDIQGIEDISEGLSENTCSKIQRRIDNIYKTLQRNGE